MIVNQANLQGLTTAYSTAFNKSFDATETYYNEIATVVPSSTREQNYNWMGQLPKMREWIGAREIQNLAAYSYAIVNKTFESTISVPVDDIEDDQYGVYTPVFSGYGESAAELPDELCFGMMMNGFEGICYDGKPFFSTQHEMGGKTFSNCSDKALSHESYELARTSMMSLTGDKGRGLSVVPNLLVVSPANERAGKMILEAELINGTSNLSKGTAKLLVVPRLAAKPHQWYLYCTVKFIKPFIFQKRKDFKLVSKTSNTDDNVFMDNAYIYGVDGRCNAGYGLWQMAYGSTGETVTQG